MKVSLGIDPDLHSIGLALVTPERVLAVGVVRIPMKYKGDAAVQRMTLACAKAIPEWLCTLQGHPEFSPAALDVVVVEGQELYLVKAGNPDSILRLGQVAGAAFCVAQAACNPRAAFIPRPKVWKGSVPKDIHQKRTLSRYGWKYKSMGKGKEAWACPTSLGAYPLLTTVQMPQSSWKHVVDAIGLGRWGFQVTKVITK